MDISTENVLLLFMENVLFHRIYISLQLSITETIRCLIVKTHKDINDRTMLRINPKLKINVGRWCIQVQPLSASLEAMLNVQVIYYYMLVATHCNESMFRY